MPESAPQPIDLSSAPARTRRLAPGLSTGVIVVAALCFLLLMGSSTAVLIESLRVQQASWDEWPVARRSLLRQGDGGTTVANGAGGPGSPGEGSGESDAAYLFDVPVVPGAENTARGQKLGDRFEDYIDVQPLPSATNQMPSEGSWADRIYALQNKRRVGDRLWMLTNPNSPFKSNVPLTPGVQRQLKLFQWWEDWAKAGYPEEVATPEEYADMEKQVADLYAKVMEKNRKLKKLPTPENPEPVRP